MNFLEVPEFQQSTYKVGLNQFFLKSFAIEDGQWGKQLLLEFAPTNEENAKVFKYWWAFQQVFESGNVSKAQMFKGNLFKFKDFISNYVENGGDVLQEIFNTVFSKPVDETNQDTLDKVQTEFFKGIFAKLPKGFEKMPINVWLHYKGGYLNIPSYKENGYNIPFGKDPIEGEDLNFEKPVRDNQPDQSEVVSETVENQVEDAPVNNGDLPF